MIFTLPERLQASQAEALVSELRAAVSQGEALELDGAQVKKVDTAGLQLLVSLGKSATSWRWAGVSADLSAAARALGLAELLHLEEGRAP